MEPDQNDEPSAAVGFPGEAGDVQFFPEPVVDPEAEIDLYNSVLVTVEYSDDVAEEPSSVVTPSEITESYLDMLRGEKDIQSLIGFLNKVAVALREGVLQPELAGYVEKLYHVEFDPSVWTDEDRIRRDALLPAVMANPELAALTTGFDDSVRLSNIIEKVKENKIYSRAKANPEPKVKDVPAGESAGVTSARNPRSLVFDDLNF